MKLLHRAERFAQLVANFRGCFPQSIEHVIFVDGLGLRAHERFATRAANCPYSHKVLRAKLRNRTIEDSGASDALANFPRNHWCKFRFGWLAHQAKRLLNLLV